MLAVDFKHVSAGGDINILVQGIAALSTDYATRIKNFLTEYLGTPEQPVPFGGRKSALADLDAWLDDPQQPPRLLLAAPAGRGKSALLVHWSQQLIQRNDLEVIFFPVSIRFRTNLASVVFASLTARLAVLHGDPVPGRPDIPSEVWRGMMTDYLARPLPDGRRLILILDGLDEAADWEPGPDLFPFSLPERTRVLLSARYRAGDIDASAWLRQLGWDHPGMARVRELSTLTPEGVAEVLKEMGCPLDRLGANVDIVAELYRLSEGDPLLVRLFVDDLWERSEAAARLQPEDLHHIQPGLKGYFQRWWDEQRRLWGNQTPLKEVAVQTLLELLACALGPLSRSDILDELAPPEAGLTTWTLDEALRPLARLVIGDGREQGYAFSHPRLNAYFKEQLTDKARQAVESRFLAWGERTIAALNKGELAPKQTSPYLVQYYGAHLERADCSTEAFLPLLSDGWRRAWYSLEGAYAGFLNDVERAWRAAELADEGASIAEKTTPHLGAEIRCALCLASINSLANNIPPHLLLSLVEKKVWTPMQGLAYARQAPKDRRAHALARLGPYLPEPLLGEALAAARTIRNEGEQAQALAGLAPRLPELLLREALAAARTIRDKRARVQAVTGLGPYLPEPLLGEALEATQAIGDEEWRARALVGLSPYLPESQQDKLLGEALTGVKTIRAEGWRAKVLAWLGPYLPEPLLGKALAAAQAIEDEVWRANALAGLAPYLPKQLLGEALVAAQAIRNEKTRAEALIGLGPHLPDPQSSEVLEEALATVRLIRDEVWQAHMLARLGPLLSESRGGEVLGEALVAAQAIRNEKVQAHALVRLGPHLSEPLLAKALVAVRAMGDERARAEVLAGLAPHLPEPLLGEALVAVQAIGDKEEQAHALGGLAAHMPGPLLMKALAAVQTIGDKEERAQALAKLGPHLPEPLLGEAIAAAQTIGDKEERAQALVGLAPHLPEPLLEEALKAARTIRSEGEQVRALIGLAPHLPKRLLGEALVAARVIRDREYRAEALTGLAPHLPEPQRGKILAEALAAAGPIRDEEYRAEALTGLAPHLPEPQRGEALTEALTVAWAIGNEKYRAEALIRRVPQLAELPIIKLYPLWREVLHYLPSRNRSNVLSDIHALTPVIAVLGGEQAVAETFHAIQEVGRWWP